jgi:N-acetylglucosaminyldiphosphoundecaprenol N-acetyl-beta-D-mannosaminyltransferase
MSTLSSPFYVLSVPIQSTNLTKSSNFLFENVCKGQKGYVIFRDVHGIVRCQDDPDFLRIHEEAALVCPDGMPLVWIGKLRGCKDIGRVYGPDLMRALMANTQDGKTTHYLYGGNVGVADKLKHRLETEYPGVNIVGTYTPPFGPLSDQALSELQTDLNTLHPDFFWVGLSTPKQEFFMHQHLPNLNTTVMLGVGAAFDYLSGEVHEPPAWIRKTGLQWLIRICQEPRRLAGRYLKTIPRFLFLLFIEQLRPDTKK